MREVERPPMVTKYLEFRQRAHPNKAAKTQCWEVRSARSGEPLGSITWFGRWRQYTFSPAPRSTFNPDCLREIAEFVAWLTAEHRARSRAA